MGSYERTRLGAAFIDTLRFWNFDQTWAHFVAPIVGLVVWAYQTFSRNGQARPVITLNTVLSALLWAGAFYAVAWIGSFLMNYVWFTPARLHSEQETHVHERDKRIADLTSQSAVPAVPQRDLERRQSVRALIAGATPEEIDFLKFILDREEIPYEHGYHDRSREAVESSIAKWRHKLIHERVERSSNATYWSIVSGLKDALIYVLYENQPPGAGRQQ